MLTEIRHVVCLYRVGFGQDGQEEYTEIEVTPEEMIGVGCIEFSGILYSYVEQAERDDAWTYVYKSFPKMLRLDDREMVAWEPVVK